MLKMKERRVFDAYEEFGFCFFSAKDEKWSSIATREAKAGQNSFNLKIDMDES